MKHVAWIVLAAAAVSYGCESSAGWRGRVAAGGGLAELTARDDGEKGSADGGQQSLRLEIAEQIKYLDNLEVGVRLKGGRRQIDDRFVGGVAYELDSEQVAVLPTFRGHVALGEARRVYGEAFAGYEYYWAEERVFGEVARGEDGGIAYGVGFGVEFDVLRTSAVFVGLEWSRHDSEERGIDLSFDDYSAVIGLAVRF
jgi:hypothetical protein